MQSTSIELDDRIAAFLSVGMGAAVCHLLRYTFTALYFTTVLYTALHTVAFLFIALPFDAVQYAASKGALWPKKEL